MPGRKAAPGPATPLEKLCNHLGSYQPKSTSARDGTARTAGGGTRTTANRARSHTDTETKKDSKHGGDHRTFPSKALAHVRAVSLAGLLTSGLADETPTTTRRTFSPAATGNGCLRFSFPVTVAGLYRIFTGFPILPPASSGQPPVTEGDYRTSPPAVSSPRGKRRRRTALTGPSRFREIKDCDGSGYVDPYTALRNNEELETVEPGTRNTLFLLGGAQAP